MNKEIGSAPARSRASSTVLLSLATWLLVIGLAALAIVQMKAPDPVPATAPGEEFSAERALNHVRVIAQTPHPLGTEANDAVHSYLVSQLSNLGLNPQIHSAVGTNTGAGYIVAAFTHDIVARLAGSANSGAIMLMAHYDSVYRAPGAADDGSGVAAILESIRALRAGPTLKNDLIVLFTDGEEPGLLGAEAFAASHPWIKDVGVILNFEARGNQGPSLLFETSLQNHALIKAVAQSAPHPIGSSLFYALYKLLPNDTDFTVFRPYKIPGLNFAFGENLEAYHSRLDTSQNLSAASLQHQGSYALGLTRYLGQMDLSQLKNQSGDDVFFDWLGSNFVTYGERWVIPGEILPTILLIFATLLHIRRSGLKITRALLALLPATALLIVIPAILALAEWLVSRLLAGHMIVGDSRANACILMGLVLAGASIGSLFLTGVRKRFNILELSTAGLFLACLLSWVLALMLPAGSYLIFWSLLLATLGLLIIGLIRKGEQPRAQILAGLIGTAITVLLFAPIIYLFYIFLTLQLVTIAAIGFLLGLFFLLCVPFINMGIPQNRGRAVVLILLICAVIMVGAGVKLSVYSPEHPRHDSILYSLNADDHSAVWISYDQSVDEWTSQFFPSKPLRQPMPNYLNGLTLPVLEAPAPLLDMAPPVADIKMDDHKDGLRTIQMNLRSPRNANVLFLTFSETVQPISVRVGARDIPVHQGHGAFTIVLPGIGTQGVDLDLTVKAPSGLSFWLLDRSFELPTRPHPRPQDFVSSEGSDVTLICRKYSL